MQLEEIRDKKVLVRLDYNVPIEDGVILNDFRIRQTYNTLNSLLDNNNKLIIASHLGRPTEGLYDESLSLKPICNHLSSKLNKKIQFIKDINDAIDFSNHDIAMLENVRFNIGEKKCDPRLSQTIASLADIFVFDAFGVSHRSECTTTGVVTYLETVAGLNIRYEIETINKLINEQSRPCLLYTSDAADD